MATRIVHGNDPQFDVPTSGEYSCRIVGHYTPLPGVGAAGVRDVHFQSNRPEKRVAELLNLRTAFRSWYEQAMRECGQEPTDGYAL